jgi:alanine racemase
VHAGGSATLFDAEQLGALQHTAREAGARLLLRPGISLYGYGPAAGEHGLRPILAWKSRITAVRRIAAGEAVSYNATYRVDRPSLIALLPVGYADGYSRLLSNRGSVLVQGRRAPVAGRVTMDQTMVDVTDIPAARPGDEVVLIGSQGAETITADELATAVGTISYEVLCALGWRVPRLWTQQPRGGEAGGGALRS